VFERVNQMGSKYLSQKNFLTNSETKSNSLGKFAMDLISTFSLSKY
jgi:hypothetical protein